MNAIILAGGKGSRLAPLTDDTPKPMLNVANRPMLDYVTSQLIYYNINDIVYAVACKKEQIRSRLACYEGVKYRVSCDDNPLGTAGSVKKASRLLHETFVVMSGDCLNDIDLDKMIEKHLTSDNLVTMAVIHREDTTKYGVVNVDENDKVVAFIEKPQNNSYGNLVNSGVYVISKELLQLIPDGVCDFARDVFPILVQNGKIGVYFHYGFWNDIGAIDDYYFANFFMLNTEFYPFVKTKNGTDSLSVLPYYPDCVVLGKCEQSIIGKGATISAKARIRRCIVMPGVTVEGEHENCIIGHNYSVNVSHGMQLPVFSTNYNNLFPDIMA